MDFETAVEKAVEDSEERNFSQSVDLIINLREVDLSDPNNRVNEDLKLPYQADDEVKVAVIGDTLIANTDEADLEITNDELEDEYFDEPNNAKSLAEEYSFIIAEAPLMPDIGQHLGQVLGPRDMMPDPMPPGSDPTDQIKSLRSTVTVRVKEAPLVQIKVGKEDQELSNVGRNANAVYEFLEGELPEGDNNIKNVLVKTTMGPTVEVS
jgi:large subunit ribosomal protein L1